MLRKLFFKLQLKNSFDTLIFTTSMSFRKRVFSSLTSQYLKILIKFVLCLGLYLCL